MSTVQTASSGLQEYESLAEDLLRICTGDPKVMQRIRKFHYDFNNLPDADIIRKVEEHIGRFGFQCEGLTIADARTIIARTLRFRDWRELEKQIDSIDRLRSKGRRVKLARVLKVLGERERSMPDATIAIKHYEEAISIYRELNEPLELAHTIRHLGNIYTAAGQYVQAGQFYKEALELYRNHEKKPTLNFANAVRSYAVLKDMAGGTEEAKLWWKEAHDLYVVVGEPMGIAECAAHLALLTKKQNNLQASQEWLSKANTAAQISKDPDTLKYIGEVRALIEG